MLTSRRRRAPREKSRIEDRLSAIERTLRRITERLTCMSAEIDSLRASVTRIETVADSAVALIHGLAEQIRQLEPDRAAIAALASEVDAKATELAAAVTENTPTAEASLRRAR